MTSDTVWCVTCHSTGQYDLWCYIIVFMTQPPYNMMEDCFRDIHNISVVYGKANGYCRAEYNISDASAILEVKTMRKPRLLQCGGCHFQKNCTNLMESNSNKFKNKTLIQQNYKRNIYTNKFHDNNNNNNMFSTGTPSFHAFHQAWSSDGMLVRVDTIKCFIGKIGKKYSFKKK